MVSQWRLLVGQCRGRGGSVLAPGKWQSMPLEAENGVFLLLFFFFPTGFIVVVVSEICQHLQRREVKVLVYVSAYPISIVIQTTGFTNRRDMVEQAWCPRCRIDLAHRARG